MNRLRKRRWGGKKANRWKYLDDPFTEAIKRRAIINIGGCERCLKPKIDIQKDNGEIFPDWQQLDCSHYYNRNTFSTRWNEDNCMGLCGGCHRYLDTHRREFDSWMLNRLGAECFQKLELQSYQRGKVDKAAVELYIKDFLARMKEA